MAGERGPDSMPPLAPEDRNWLGRTMQGIEERVAQRLEKRLDDKVDKVAEEVADKVARKLGEKLDETNRMMLRQATDGGLVNVEQERSIGKLSAAVAKHDGRIKSLEHGAKKMSSFVAAVAAVAMMLLKVGIERVFGVKL